ncbi:MAG: flagellar motor switch protein FliN [Proteobacteria bacterium]|nr:flagellar motor switch protein FliN [Pseudomonadota bacterium]
MADNDKKMPLPNLDGDVVMKTAPDEDASAASDAQEMTTRSASDLEAVFDVPVQLSAVLGRARMDVGELLTLKPGTVLELDRRVGEAIDIYVNNRLIARGEVVLVEDKLGVTMTEIIKAERG